MNHLKLIFHAQIRSQEWYAELYEMDFWKNFDPVTVEHKDRIVMIVDAFEDGPFTKIFLSLN